MASIFIVGATGYIGGAVLTRLLSENPSLNITALVRTDAKADQLKAAHPTVKTVLGDLDSSDTLTALAAQHDIIITAANSDHPEHITAIYEGMAQNKSGKPTYLIHTSGTGITLDTSLKHAGEAVQSEISDKNWDDVADYTELVNFPLEQLHRNVDVLVQAPPVDRNPNIRYAIICPPLIWGESKGAINTRSIQIPLIIHSALQRGQAFHIGSGENRWSHVHVEDLVDLYISLIEDALKEDGGKAGWSENGGWYFAESGVTTWGEITRTIAKVGYEKGLFKSDEAEAVDVPTAASLNRLGPVLWGLQSLTTATRAREAFGWNPKELDILGSLEGEVEVVSKK
ncbi:hypothetical protein H072_434 [Dactylellina haptotyla CBS 200.50]|uniref:Uncharacterized protein n=1 Tax=Dactylellina haptotyla (strain CBS 200.50) TaxID=1284197 RepID=S8AX08_DACHA|nr:hypothetical protein H072_434 [Dactylellina haptotyla CBS 200.50]